MYAGSPANAPLAGGDTAVTVTNPPINPLQFCRVRNDSGVVAESNITDVQRGATETETASSHVLSAAQLLSSDSNRLKIEVAKFLESVRAA